MTIQINDGKILIVGGQIATDADCCCGDDGCLPCAFPCDDDMCAIGGIITVEYDSCDNIELNLDLFSVYTNCSVQYSSTIGDTTWSWLFTISESGGTYTYSLQLSQSNTGFHTLTASWELESEDCLACVTDGHTMDLVSDDWSPSSPFCEPPEEINLFQTKPTCLVVDECECTEDGTTIIDQPDILVTIGGSAEPKPVQFEGNTVCSAPESCIDGLLGGWLVECDEQIYANDTVIAQHVCDAAGREWWHYQDISIHYNGSATTPQLSITYASGNMHQDPTLGTSRFPLTVKTVIYNIVRQEGSDPNSCFYELELHSTTWSVQQYPDFNCCDINGITISASIV